MLTNKLLICLFLILFAFSCNKEYNFKDDRQFLSNISYEVNSKNTDSLLIICFNFKNNSIKDFLMPITDWVYCGKKINTDEIFAQPDEPFIINTISYFPKGSNLLNGIFHIDLMKEFKKWPKFILINSKRNTSFCITLSKFFIGNDNKLYLRFMDKQNYEFQLKLSLISKDNITNLLDKDFNIYNLITSINNIKIPSLHYNKHNYEFIKSQDTIDADKCFKLNLLGSNKLLINFNVNIR